MIHAVLFDLGGTLHTVDRSEALQVSFARRLIDRLGVYDIAIKSQPEELGKLLQENAAEYKCASEKLGRELPPPRIWNEYYLKQFEIGEERLAPIAEELSFIYDYERVCNKRRPKLVETIETLDGMGFQQGIISNMISVSFVPHMLKEHGVDKYMSCVIVSSEVGLRKPDRRIFDMALEVLGRRPEEAAYVGDTISRDVLGARNAGLALAIQIKHSSVAHIDAPLKEKGPKPDFLIDSLDEIPQIIREYNFSALATRNVNKIQSFFNR